MNLRLAFLAASWLALALLSTLPAFAAAPPLSGVVAIAAGGHHTCALTDAGAAYCWGDNTVGQLGDGTFQSRAGPALVNGLSHGVVRIAAGYSHTCALLDVGAVVCWGDYDFDFGEGASAVRTTPVGLDHVAIGVVAIAAGGHHSCAVMASGGVKCWGRNTFGQLGDGTTIRRHAPVDVQGLAGPVVAVAPSGIPGAGHTCALTAAGGVQCWGFNAFGELGDGTTTNRSAPVGVAGLSSGVVAIGTADSRSCALMASGGVKCWGGHGADSVLQSTPVDEPGLASGIARLAMMGGHACFVTAAGGAKCAGRNDAGQLGRGFYESGSPLGDVSGLTSGVAAVAVGSLHSCALTVSGEMRCWGAGHLGQLGDGAFHPLGQLIPVTVRLFTEQSIVFGALPPRALDESPVALAASASSGLPVEFRSLTPEVCTVSGAALTLVAFGACTVAAQQPGDADFLAAPPVARGFVVRDPAAASMPRLGNIAARAHAGSTLGDAVLIAGFVIGGSTPKTIVVRARGPSLVSFGVPGLLQDPRLELHSADQGLIAANDDWRLRDQDIAARIESLGLAPLVDRESAILLTLPPGAYTAILTAARGPPLEGVAIVEVFEVDRPETPLVNISARAHVHIGGQVLIGGFVIQGDAPQAVVVRARGPSLAPYGIVGYLFNPTLTLVRSSDQAIVATNDDWNGAPNAADIAASGFAPSHDFESAILVTLPPGAYTAIVSGSGGGSGIGIVEVFRK